MPIVRVTIPNPDDLLRVYGALAPIRLERSATEAGVYAEIATQALVTQTYSYEFDDTTGTSTSWYRYRVSNAANTVQSPYSTPGSPTEPDAYATLDDLLLTTSQPTNDTRLLARYERALREATLDIDREIGYSALRETGEFLFHGDGKGVLHVHRGIISLDSIDIRLSFGDSWTALQAQDTGWYLEGELGKPVAWDGVYYHVRLPDTANYTEFPDVKQGVRLTGTLGGDAERRRAATVAWARQKVGMDNAPMGSVIAGPEDLGGPISIDRWPRAVYDLVQSERHRFWCHV
jgi:hypothetical protein